MGFAGAGGGGAAGGGATESVTGTGPPSPARRDPLDAGPAPRLGGGLAGVGTLGSIPPVVTSSIAGARLRRSSDGILSPLAPDIGPGGSGNEEGEGDLLHDHATVPFGR